MKYSWYKESHQFGQVTWLITTTSKTANIKINKVIEPVMNDNIPLSIIRTKLNTIPPIGIKAPIRKPGNLSPTIKPAMKEAKESQNQKESRG